MPPYRNGDGDELDGNSMPRTEKRLERAQVENGGKGYGEEEEGAGEREEGCTGVALLWVEPDSQRRTSAKVRPFRRLRGLTVGGGDCHFILGLEVQSPSFE